MSMSSRFSFAFRRVPIRPPQCGCAAGYARYREPSAARADLCIEVTAQARAGAAIDVELSVEAIGLRGGRRCVGLVAAQTRDRGHLRVTMREQRTHAERLGQRARLVQRRRGLLEIGWILPREREADQAVRPGF